MINPEQKRKGKKLIAIAVGAVVATAMGIAFMMMVPNIIGVKDINKQLEKQINEIAELDVKINKIGITPKKNSLISINADNIELKNEKGIEIGKIEEINVALRPLAILNGNIKARDININNAKINVNAIYPTLNTKNNFATILEQKNINFSEMFENLPTIFNMIEKMMEQYEINDVGITNLQIDTNETNNITIKQLDMEKSVNGLVIESEIMIGQYPLDVEGTWVQSSSGGMVLDASVNASEIENNKNIISASLHLPFSKTGTVLESHISVDVKENDTEANLSFSFSPLKNRFDLVPSKIELPNFVGTIKGWMTYPTGKENNNENAKFNLEIADIEASLLNTNETAVSANFLIIGSVNPELKTIQTEKIQLTTGETTLKGNGILGFENSVNSPSVNLELELDYAPINVAKQLWPEFLATKLRLWAKDNLTGAQLKNAKINARFPPDILGRLQQIDYEHLPKDYLTLDIEFEDANIKFLDELPATKNAKGKIMVKGLETSILFDKGKIEFPNTNVDITGGELTFVETTYNQFDADIDLSLSASIKDFVKLGNHPTLDYSQSLVLPATEFLGNANANVLGTFIFDAENGDILETDWYGTAKTINGELQSPLNSHNFKNANLNITFSPISVLIEGELIVDDKNAYISILEYSKSEKIGHRKISLELNNDDLTELGFENTYISGPVIVEIDIDPEFEQEFKVDFQKAEIQIPWVNWRKEKNVEGIATFTMSAIDDITTIRSLKFKGNEFNVEGEIRLGAEGILLEAEMKNVKLNPKDNFSLNIKRVSNGFEIAVSGESYDGKAIIQSLIGGGKTKNNQDAPNITLNAQLKQMHGFKGEYITDINLFYRQTDNEIVEVRIYSQAPSGAPVLFLIRENANETQATFASEDAGATLKFLDIYTNMEEGSMKANLKSNKNGIYKGGIDIDNFYITNETRLSKFLDDDAQNIGEEQPDRVLVKRIRSLVEMGNKYLKLPKASLLSEDVGAVFKGTIYDENNNIDLSGTYLPGYQLNNFLSKIPIFGPALGDGGERGLLGVTFKLTGEYTDPNIAVNPASVITPGILRDLFEF